MKLFMKKLNVLCSETNSYWSERILTEIKFAKKLSEINQNKFDPILNTSLNKLFDYYSREKTISKSIALKIENLLEPIRSQAKEYSILCAAHAHIDMNWMWGYAETVGVTLDTFRTMLDLMNEYPEYKFSQSQASVYEIVEKHDPKLLSEIKERVHEGRWEVTASTWVEADKNMPNGESQARHILYTKKYLSNLLDIHPDELSIDFEPDTFGHNLNVPEILQNAGVNYYYHCRGYDEHLIYKWRSPSGKDIIVYREPLWYNSEIEASMGLFALEFCTKHNIKTMLKVYGVGNHGGGPTRMDIEKIIDMKEWPIYPTIHFGTLKEFFKIIETVSNTLPVVDSELNFIFTGCYTSQSRIKLANRISEVKLCESEIFSSISCTFLNNTNTYPHLNLQRAWKNTLFNQFHDILPGSGVIETREYAMGLFQDTIAYTNTAASKSLRNIASKINTKALWETNPLLDSTLQDIQSTKPLNSRAEGAGAGYGLGKYLLPQTERGKGSTRIVHVFNQAPYERSEIVEITLWDWDANTDQIVVCDEEHKKVMHQVLSIDNSHSADSRYWGHKYTKLLIHALVPAFGYNTYIIKETISDNLKIQPVVKIDGGLMDQTMNPRVKQITPLVLENTHIKATFDQNSMALTSLYCKSDDTELISTNQGSGIFRYIKEDDALGMTSWILGKYTTIDPINLSNSVIVKGTCIGEDKLKQWIEYTIEFNCSSMKVNISLTHNSSNLDYMVECDWQEKPIKGQYVPQLSFYVPFTYSCSEYIYDIPMGTVKRPSLNMDVPGSSFVYAGADNSTHGLLLITDSKYGFRGNNNSISITLLRSSYDPDPYPELGIHKFSFSLSVMNHSNNQQLIYKAYDFTHPMHFLSGKIQNGNLPLKKSFISIESNHVAFSSLKKQENDSIANHVILRLYETEGLTKPSTLVFDKPIINGYFVDINEMKFDETTSDNELISIEGKTLCFSLAPYSIGTLYVEF